LIIAEIRKNQRVLVERKLAVAAEYYMGLIIDENNRCDALIFGKGGVDVEEAAGEGGLSKLLIHPLEGLMNFQAKLLAESRGIDGRLLNAITRLARQLYGIYIKYDATLLEVNPLVVTEAGEVFAGDMRMEIDDDALSRQSSALAAFGIEPREDRGRPPTKLEVEAEKIDKIDHRGVVPVAAQELPDADEGAQRGKDVDEGAGGDDEVANGERAGLTADVQPEGGGLAGFGGEAEDDEDEEADHDKDDAVRHRPSGRDIPSSADPFRDCSHVVLPSSIRFRWGARHLWGALQLSVSLASKCQALERRLRHVSGSALTMSAPSRG